METSGTVEAERKFEADPSTPLPDLHEIDGIGTVGEPANHSLEAIYFDTRHLALAARGITLRRRTGGTDAGWHLKLPLGPGKRTEIHAPLGAADTVPVELMDRVLAYTRGHAVAAVATLTTERISYALYGQGGERLADFVDDYVRAHVTVGEPRELEWREWEVEVAAHDGTDDALLDSLTAQLTDAGATPSERTSKLATALGESWPALKGTGGESFTKGGTAVVPVRNYLADQVADLLLQDAHVRLGRDDAVHQMRSLIRRIRSVLHSYRKLFEPAPVKDLESGLKSLAKTLGRYRDAEVLHARLGNRLDELPGKLVLGPLHQELDQRMAVRANTAMASIKNRLNSPRYFRLLDELEALIDAPPVSPLGAAPAGETTAKLVNKAAKRLVKRHNAAVGAAVGPQRDTAFHEVRKSAKKLRFAAAAVESVHGKRAAKVEDAAHKVQSILGEHQDSVMAGAELLKLGSAQGVSSGAFTYGVLHAMERTAADTAQEDYLRHSRKALKLRLKK
ncbi:CHAD domain-containing protein [Paenarthrobacter nitroguajacolicus]|uniref:CYTH and CHAD domain-containing protein n=1 Tax=Paenarthrobacter nitroguajacolicus TaxID=211146 RepID=UPI002863B695|nr:CYTH and CHAD domain-containing protein [Paenarthrobacter nitroguajacolicus]MDR6989568.1 CHAD domain-containing protein [Paenarthrobacter nitroguajacolicus]